MRTLAEAAWTVGREVAGGVTGSEQAADAKDRIGFRAGGERTEFIELSEILYFRAENKLTFAVTAAKKHAVNYSLTELEQKLDPRDFVRIHRSILLNTNYVKEIHPWFAGRVLIRLKDEKRTELTVSRDRVRTLKERLNF